MASAAVETERARLASRIAKISLSNPVETPADYTKFAFQLPHERYVGLLSCQIDPNLRELETLVTKCRKRSSLQGDVAVSKSNGKEKGKQKNKKGPPVEEEELWEIELLDTVLFPEGGGQASDTGSIRLLDEDNKIITVKEVVRKELSAVHVCTGPIPEGARVLVEVDWARRHDLCTQHTAQHLLSAVLETTFDCPTLGWALSSFPNLSYVELPRCPTKEELDEAERICNELVVEGRRVRVEMKLSEDENRPKSLPADYIGGVVRTVIIDDLDISPCCGTHYPTLAPIQAIHVSPFTTPIRGTNTRVYFLAGPRVNRQLTTSLTTLRAAGAELSCSSEELANRTKGAVESVKESMRMSRRLREELADFVAAKILDTATAGLGESDPLVYAMVREEDATNDLEFLTLVQVKVKDRLQGTKRMYAFALAQSGSGTTTTTPDGCLLIFASENQMVVKAAECIKKGESRLTKRLKGGGKGRWQGKVSEGKISRKDENELHEILRRAVQ